MTESPLGDADLPGLLDGGHAPAEPAPRGDVRASNGDTPAPSLGDGVSPLQAPVQSSLESSIPRTPARATPLDATLFNRRPAAVQMTMTGLRTDPSSAGAVPPQPPTQAYHRYHIPTQPAPPIVEWPSRFRVKVKRLGLVRLLASELWHYRGNLDVVMSRPCLYGVFSGPFAGFAPREQLCVGCLRCTTQYPDFVEIRHNEARRRLGDGYFRSGIVDAVAYEAETGNVPVRGAGYRGPFTGSGWDAMWTDMSEIVRPTRDGIHGREFISTVVDLGGTPPHLAFDESGGLLGEPAAPVTLNLPILFDTPPDSARTEASLRALAWAAARVGSLAVLPIRQVVELGLGDPSVAPLVGAADEDALAELPDPRVVELDGWDERLMRLVQRRWPAALVIVRVPMASAEALPHLLAQGVRGFHLTADYHGRGPDGAFALDMIRSAHLALVGAGRRDEATLIGSGGIVAAEHVPKAIIAGLDAVAIDTTAMVAMQATFDGDCTSRAQARLHLPPGLTPEWGAQRLTNLAASWRDQLLEILGAMGLREVRRLRGEMGRAMFHADLEREAFAGIEGFDG